MLPYTRQMIKSLKIDFETLKRESLIHREAQRIYTSVLDFARAGNETYCAIELLRDAYVSVDDIIFELNKGFPDSIIEKRILTRGVDGDMYETSCKVDSIGIRLQRKQFQKVYITIDWS